jgi:DNA-directed RNA polymerase specialized sigma24 family protein
MPCTPILRAGQKWIFWKPHGRWRKNNSTSWCLKAFSGSKKQSRDLLMMDYYMELSIADMAKKLWVSETTILRRLRAAEQQLKHMMATWGQEVVDYDA